jgi:hypothetical protein
MLMLISMQIVCTHRTSGYLNLAVGLLGEARNDFVFGGGSDRGVELASVTDYLFGGAGRDVFGIQDLPA